ncbi:hypothetical protein LLEC1_00666 [Akanthomyces lecanii]|uniref:Serine/arginine repetitive matrix protein 1 n=1 Tax=Cordyceps confragosa TaxID=2714763 RepID=A0A179IJM4_CORDF|nr:hypothetical protein LLEC1_00666 [Akanthomyces lecanii]
MNDGRFDDGEVVRYGAGESWRPTPRDRSPRRHRSPARSRERGPPRSPRPRSPPLRPRSPGMGSSAGAGSGPGGSDSYVPGRYVPRRRSRSIGFRRERSRDRVVADSPRRRDRTRSPLSALAPRSPLPTRSPMRRSPLHRSPPPGRRSPPPPRSPARRASPIRDMRFDRDRPQRSPRRVWGRDRPRDTDRDREWDRERVRDNRERDLDRRDDRRRSRSPFGRGGMDRTSGKTTPSGFRPRSRSPGRRDDRYRSYRRPSPPRDSGISSAIPSQPASGRASPIPRVRSPYTSRDHSPRYFDGPGRDGSAGVKSPPRGPAALRIMPSGPRSGGGPLDSPSSRSSGIPDTASPTNAPCGPRGYLQSGRGGFQPRSSRGGWSQPPSRAGPSPGPSTPIGSSGIPTGPRSQSISGQGGASTPTQGRPFNPPTGPAAQHVSGPRQTLAQSLISTMPPLIPGGKLDPSMLPMVLGVLRDAEPHYRKLRDEEEKIREELRAKQERLRKSLSLWGRLERDAAAWELRSDLSEKSMKNLAGEGMGGAAF